MFCSNCGEKIDDSDKYCPSCGRDLSNSNNKDKDSDTDNVQDMGLDNEEKSNFNGITKIKEVTNTIFNGETVDQKIILAVILLTAVICFSFVFSIDGDAVPVGNEILGPTSPLDSDTDNDGLKDGVELRAYDTDPLKSDTDGDGLEDGRELDETGTNPTLADTDGDGLADKREVRDLETSPIKSDTDEDGLDDAGEINADTDATNSDTDNDGVEDGREVEIGTDPLIKDTDEDGLEDGLEINKYDSDPLVTDTDSDNISDGEEVNNLGTDPTLADTDSDGLDDNNEIYEYGTDPTLSDTDNDSLEDGEEIERGTNPLKSDSDSDGLEDGEEVSLGSDPLVKDTDNDGLNDGEEVNRYNTSPVESDTDSDGVDDARELRLGIEPDNSDTDNDELLDGRELELGTNPTDSDTDKDGLPDGFEDGDDADFQSDLNPMHKDVLVEMDTDTSTNIPQELGFIVNEFSRAPISNPDNTEGINLHIYYSEKSINTKDTQSLDYYVDNAYDSEFDLKGYGFYHALIVDGVSNDSVGGVTSSSIDGMIVEDSSDNERVSARLAHELGHQLGLLPEDFDGIDSKEYTFDSYPSTMNYVCRNQNRLLQPRDCGVVQYSSGGEFDDWEHIEDSLPDVVPSTDKIG